MQFASVLIERLCILGKKERLFHQERLYTLDIFTWLCSLRWSEFISYWWWWKGFQMEEKSNSKSEHKNIALFCTLASVHFQPCWRDWGFDLLRISTFIYFPTHSHHLQPLSLSEAKCKECFQFTNRLGKWICSCPTTAEIQMNIKC